MAPWLDDGLEECDDGNRVAGDGCDACCQNEYESCTDALDITPLWDPQSDEIVITGSLHTMDDEMQHSCGGDGSDLVLSLTNEEATSYELDYNMGENEVLALYAPGCAEELACDAAGQQPGSATLTLELGAGETIFIVLDHDAVGTGSDFSLTIRRAL